MLHYCINTIIFARGIPNQRIAPYKKITGNFTHGAQQMTTSEYDH